MPVLSGSAAFNRSVPANAGAVIGVQAVFDDEEATKRQQRYQQRLKRTEQAVDDFAKRTEQSGKKSQKATQSSFETQMRVMREFRWELITTMFFIRTATQIGTAALERMAEVSEQMAMRGGAKALAESWGVSVKGIRDDLQGLDSVFVGVQESYSIALRGMLADQGQFSSEYANFWQAARVAAVTSGADADRVFTALIQSMVQGKGEIADAVTPVFQLQRALEDYALASGRTADQLSLQERQQVILNQVQEQTNTLLDSGAQKALDLSEKTEILKDAWERFTGVLAATNLDPLKEDLANIIETATQLILILSSIPEAGTKFSQRYTGNEGPVGEYLPKWLQPTARAIDSYMGWAMRLSDEMIEQGTANIGEALQKVFEEDYALFGQTKTFQETADIAVGIDTGAVDEAAAATSDYSDRLEEARRRMELMEIAGAGIERALDAIADAERRADRAAADYNRRLGRLERDWQRDKARIDRRAALQAERAIRAAEQQRIQAEQEANSRVEQMREEHAARMRHNQQRYNMQQAHNEALYLFERQRLIAEGDSIAIEELDARYELERQMQEESFQLQQQQQEELFQIQLKYAQQAAQEQLRVLQQGLEAQLQEIELRRREEQEERDTRYREQQDEAEEAYRDQQDALEDSLEQQLLAIGRGLQKQADETGTGYGEILDIIEEFLGPGGQADSVIEGFLQRHQEITIPIRFYIQTGSLPQFGSMPYSAMLGGLIGGRQRFLGGGQYGGEFETGSQGGYVGVHPGERVSVNPQSTIGHNMTMRWAGQPIQVNVSGASGVDGAAIGSQLTSAVVVELTEQLRGFVPER